MPTFGPRWRKIHTHSTRILLVCNTSLNLHHLYIESEIINWQLANHAEGLGKLKFARYHSMQ